jgi:tyrosine-protein phosphatase non-receptor type 9
MLEFRQKVRDELDAATKLCDWPSDRPAPPIVVHCSAGIGRTGTFITLDISILRLQKSGRVCIQNTVEKIRSQRAHSIQTQDQYVFCYLALLEYALINNMLTNVDLSGFDDSDSELDD